MAVILRIRVSCSLTEFSRSASAGLLCSRSSVDYSAPGGSPRCVNRLAENLFALGKATSILQQLPDDTQANIPQIRVGGNVASGAAGRWELSPVLSAFVWRSAISLNRIA